MEKTVLAQQIYFKLKKNNINVMGYGQWKINEELTIKEFGYSSIGLLELSNTKINRI